MKTAVEKCLTSKVFAKKRSLARTEWHQRSRYRTESIVNRKQAVTEETDGLEDTAAEPQVLAVWMASMADREDWAAMTAVLTSRFRDFAPGAVSGFVVVDAVGERLDGPSRSPKAAVQQSVAVTIAVAVVVVTAAKVAVVVAAGARAQGRANRGYSSIPEGASWP